jgi:poly(A) polymerase
MDNLLDKFFLDLVNLDYISQNLKDITKQTPAHKIFEALNNYSEDSEVRYVGGCVRRIIKNKMLTILI